MVYFDNHIKQNFDALNLEYTISENNKNTYFLIDETMIVIKFGDIANSLKEKILQLNLKSFNLLIIQI